MGRWCAPGPTDNVRIAGTHTVTLTGTETCNNITIDNTGVLAHGTQILNVSGDYTNNGTETIGNSHDRLRLNGINTNIDGTGTISISANRRAIRIYTGDKTVLSSADLAALACSLS